MSTLAKINHKQLQISEILEISHHLASTPFYAKLGKGGVFAIILTAQEMGLPFMSCLNGGLYNVDGKVSLSAQLMNAIIQSHGHDVDIIYLNDKGCKLKFTRKNNDGTFKEFEYEFKEEDALRAKLIYYVVEKGETIVKGKDNWIKYPKDMYYARALSGGAKKHFSGILICTYVHGELEDADAEFIKDAANCNISPAIYADFDPIKLFKEKHNLGSPEKNLIEQYIDIVSEKSKKDVDYVISCAASNEFGFLEKFEQWKKSLKQNEDLT